MSETSENKINPITYIICLCIAFAVIFYGTRAFADYNMMKKALKKVEFLEKNNAPYEDVCSALNWALDVSEQVQDQKQYSALTQKIKQQC